MTCSMQLTSRINGTAFQSSNSSSRFALFPGTPGNLAVGCGGVALSDEYAEVKRMYTRPAVRGLGVAKGLLRRIEEEARTASVPALRVETGIHQREAIGLYESAGFRPCGPFGPYATMPADSIETSIFFEKGL